MDRYGRIAQRHWSRWLPGTVATLPDPEAFFTALGLQVGEEIDARADELAGDDPGGEDYLEKVGRLRMARFTAEETILRERVLLPPEDPAEEPEEAAAEPVADDPAELAARPDRDGWIPMAVDPAHPAWAAELERRQYQTEDED